MENERKGGDLQLAARKSTLPPITRRCFSHQPPRLKLTQKRRGLCRCDNNNYNNSWVVGGVPREKQHNRRCAINKQARPTTTATTTTTTAKGLGGVWWVVCVLWGF